MGDTRFDELTKTLAGDASRRSMLKSIAVVAAGGLVALLGPRGAEAQRKKHSHCAQAGESCVSASCCGSLVCNNGVCVKEQKKH